MSGLKQILEILIDSSWGDYGNTLLGKDLTLSMRRGDIMTDNHSDLVVFSVTNNRSEEQTSLCLLSNQGHKCVTGLDIIPKAKEQELYSLCTDLLKDCLYDGRVTVKIK